MTANLQALTTAVTNLTEAVTQVLSVIQNAGQDDAALPPLTSAIESAIATLQGALPPATATPPATTP